MERISNENTALATNQNLTIDMVKQGVCLEFDAEKKLNRKQEYTLLQPVTKVIELYTKDLQAAYLTIEQMEEELAQTRQALDEVTEAATKSAEQVRQVLAGERKFTEAETKLAELMAGVAQLQQSHADDEALIAKLKQQIVEMQHLADTVPELAQDVQFVLDALEQSLEASGINLDDILDSME